MQLPCPQRLETLHELTEEAVAKVLIFAPYRCTVAMVAADRTARGKKVGIIHGGIGKSERSSIFHGFQNGDIDEIVAQPGAMAHGLTLTAADLIAWYAPIDNNEIYEQANGRITRPSQNEQPVIAHIEGSPAERVIYGRLKRQQDFQNVVLELLQTEVGDGVLVS